MKVILNVDAITHPLTGIGRYALNLGQALAAHEEIEHIKFFSADHWVEDIELSTAENKWLSAARTWIPIKSLALKLYASRRASKFTQLSVGMEEHVLHSPNFILMPFVGRSVATFHDLSFVNYRETQPGYRLKFLDHAIPKTLQQADALVTPTNYVKQEIIKHYAYPAERIHVTPLGVSEGFKTYTEEQCQATLQAHGLGFKTYVLAVATTEPRKNLMRLIQAYSLLSPALRRAQPLVLVGSAGWLNGKLNRTIKTMVQQGQIISLGYVSQQQLQHLYAAATLTAFPSLYEGFGLPIIESMASGTPVLTSTDSAMAEVAANHALLCNPLDVDDIAARLKRGLEDVDWISQAQSAGCDHAANFTWQRCATATTKAYR
ncbi:glycosyltransferase family 1 protein [Marinicella sp. S1101]|uniref:glycosyltransferase family 4 protein n=1 Tax=Marinicella marina TaxID=2996016 RepID=UPI002260F3C9|nr:glycosyltransferase family 1 protein [Marinicella marina]MCX7553327.1 glycosyltransferase family 1 protein [Marinicella marina]MDJ1139059.1 glycosyltransferase family 1 protein [Marinicella marina]